MRWIGHLRNNVGIFVHQVLLHPIYKILIHEYM